MTDYSPPTGAVTTPVHLMCPTCGAIPAQRIDTVIERRTIAACVCRAGHLFITDWEVDD